MYINLNGILYEAVNRQFVIYHRTNLIKNINSLGINGVLPELNDSALYGKGLYATTSLQSQFGLNNYNSRESMEYKYGKYIVKIRTVADNLLICNPNLDEDLTISVLWNRIKKYVNINEIAYNFLIRIMASILHMTVNEELANLSKILELPDRIDNYDIKYFKETVNIDISKEILKSSEGYYGVFEKLLNIYGNSKLKKNISQGGFIQDLRISKILDNFRGFCFYGDADGDVAVIKRGAVMNPIAYSQASPLRPNEIEWKLVSKQVNNSRKKLLHNTINSDGDLTPSFDAMLTAYRNDDLKEFTRIIKEKPDLLNKELKGRNIISYITTSGEDSPGFLQVIVDNIKMPSYEIKKNLLISFMYPGETGHWVSANMILQMLNVKKGGELILDKSKVEFSSEILLGLFSGKIDQAENVLNQILDSGSTLMDINRYNYSFEELVKKLIANKMYEIINKLAINLKDNINLRNVMYSVFKNSELSDIVEANYIFFKNKKYLDLYTMIMVSIEEDNPRHMEYESNMIKALLKYVELTDMIGFNEAMSSERYFDILLNIGKATLNQFQRNAMIKLVSECTYDYSDMLYKILKNVFNPTVKYKMLSKYGVNPDITLPNGVSMPLIVYSLLNDDKLFDIMLDVKSIDLDKTYDLPREGKLNLIYLCLKYNKTYEYEKLIEFGAKNQIPKDSKINPITDPILITYIKKYNVSLV